MTIGCVATELAEFCGFQLSSQL